MNRKSQLAAIVKFCNSQSRLYIINRQVNDMEKAQSIVNGGFTDKIMSKTMYNVIIYSNTCNTLRQKNKTLPLSKEN